MNVHEIYANLHALAEPPLEEFRTSAYLEEKIEQIGMKCIAKIGTGLIAVHDSLSPGPQVGLRADMDALKYVIDGKTQYRHCCGHDANMTMVLGSCAQILERGIKKGRLVVIFQPAEEILQGARLMANSGKIPDLDFLFGIHLRPIAETPLGEATPALCHGASRILKVIVHGKNAHGARPHLGVNAIEAVVAMINGIQAIKIDPRIPHSAKITMIRGGETNNIIPDKATFSLDMRAQTNEAMETLRKKIYDVLESICQMTGASYEIIEDDGCLAAIYDDECVQIAKKSIETVLGKSNPPIITPGGEDFHYYTSILGVKAGYIGIGANLKPGLHDPDMSFDFKALEYGRDILTEVVLSQLG